MKKHIGEVEKLYQDIRSLRHDMGNHIQMLEDVYKRQAFGLRAKAKNFSMEEMKEGIEFAHAHDVKVYVTANILAHNDDLEGCLLYTSSIIRNISEWRRSRNCR